MEYFTNQLVNSEADLLVTVSQTVRLGIYETRRIAQTTGKN